MLDGINSWEHLRRDTGGKKKVGKNVTLTERNAAATRFEGNKFLREGQKKHKVIKICENVCVCVCV